MTESDIRHASPDDAAAVYQLQRTTWLATYPSVEHGVSEDDVRALIERGGVESRVERWRRRFSDADQPQAFVATADDGTVIGFVAPFLGPTRDDEQRLGAIYVLPGWQSRGIGHELVERAVSVLDAERDIHLHVAAYNDRAIAFYERHGFRRSGLDTTQHGNGPVIPEFEMVRPAERP